MRVPISQLRRLVDIPDQVSVEQLKQRMNGRISEVEHLIRFPTREQFAGVRVARLGQVVEPTPDFGRWTAQVGDRQVHLVVGTRHGVVSGGLYACVLAGEAAPDGSVAEARPVDGLDSDGLLLSEASAGIGADAANPLSFSPDIDPSADPFDLLELDDVVLEFDLEPNRSDLYSLIGMARDVAAIYGTQLKPLASASTDWPELPRSALAIEIRSDNCKRYAALEVSGVQVGPSPQWLQNAVRKLGMRPISNIVDAANLAMLELGQPMHAFDRRQLKTGVIGLRMATPGERITTLDGAERELTDECLLVTDGDTPIALAGVMGDQDSEIRGDTTDVLIESAAFDMFTVRRCGRRLALRTEASLRFEKGLPQSGVLTGVARLAQLLLEVGGPQLRLGRFQDAWPSPPAAHSIAFQPSEARARLGMDVPDELIRQRFQALGFQVTEAETGWTVGVPDYRPDLLIQQDLNEEVGRIHGYEHVIATLPVAPLAPPRANPVFTRGFALRRTLTGLGFDEVYLGQWLGEEQVASYGIRPETLLELKNPLVEHYRYFRPSSLPDLVEAVRLNRKKLDEVRLFEVAKVYGRVDGALVERHHLSGAVASPGTDAGERFYAARDAALTALGALGLEARVQVGEAPLWALPHCFHPGRQALIAVEGVARGFVGELHPRTVSSLDLAEPFAAFFIDLEGLLDLEAGLRRFTPPPRFPSIEIHVNVLAASRQLASSLLDQVGAVGLDHLVRHGVRDVYSGKGVPHGHKRITLELEFNHPQRSLTQDEVLGQVRRLPEALQGVSVEL
jgi:phenylalanyl-tRNA synthetase beta chain